MEYGNSKYSGALRAEQTGRERCLEDCLKKG